jgi:hypothetical protein
MTRIVQGLLALSLLSGPCLAQQPQPTRQLQAPKPKESVDYGSLFYVYDKSVNSKTRKESLDDFALFLKINPNFKGYLISYGARSRATSLKKYLTGVHHVNPTRVGIIDGGNCREWKIDLLTWVTAAPVKPAVSPCPDSRLKPSVRTNPRFDGAQHNKSLDRSANSLFLN